MGVHGLWELLAPVGRRVSVETLAGKKVAIDASIWMIQFMKAMRDEKGEMVRNAHILGFFRRICKLLFLRTKPVFVFDGGTPALKRRTVIARRRQRENAQAKIRKTAEKLLLNHLKAMRLKELAADLENQRKMNDTKGKKVISEVSEEMEMGNDAIEKKGQASKSFDQEMLDGMLAASLAAEQDGIFTADASASGSGIPVEEEDTDEDEEEMILPELHGKVDPAVLAALPPSMQLDLLVQMRERLMAENRQKYQKVKKAPARFSELQIQAYLKTVAFRREIDEVQKSAAGRGIGGVKTSRIASEANREFIFSSSFTGDKQILTSGNEERSSNVQSCTSSANPAVEPITSPTIELRPPTLPSVDEPSGVIHDDVETYLDERGRVRVSRLRAMGIRMTRDLQRNLHLMKEIDEAVDTNRRESDSAITENMVDLSRISLNGNQIPKHSGQDDESATRTNDQDGDFILGAGDPIEISFEGTEDQKCNDDVDDLFARLVAGHSIIDVSSDNHLPQKQDVDRTSHYQRVEGNVEEKGDAVSSIVNKDTDTPCITEFNVDDEDELEWEDGTDKGSNVLSSAIREENQPSLPQLMNDEDDVEWEDGSLDVRKEPSSGLSVSRGMASKGALEEEADVQEAIRRSLEDINDGRCNSPTINHQSIEEAAQRINQDTHVQFTNEIKDSSEHRVPMVDSLRLPESPSIALSNISKFDCWGKLGISKTDNFPNASPTPTNGANKGATEESCGIFPDSVLSMHEASPSANTCRKIHVEVVTPGENLEIAATKEQLVDTSVSDNADSRDVESYFGASSSSVDPGTDSFPSAVPDRPQQRQSAATPENCNLAAPELITYTINGSGISSYSEPRLAEGEVSNDVLMDKDDLGANSVLVEDVNVLAQVTEARLEEEMINLSEERKELGVEQRKQERNAESVSGEMFAECQELLQMFGLPYIIAPMEAEAQCAYMELSNLVDGVVTDDSDVFLFGARSVYKNIFDDRKYVETYFMKDIENELGLTREKLIRMALLLGSDYTEGVSGIGIVNAVEVINAFPEEDGLQKFREWIESPDPAILGKVDVQGRCNPKKKVPNFGETDKSSSNSNLQGIAEPVDDFQKMKQIFMDKHRNVSKNWHIPSSFPSDAVIAAYDSPHVDNSTEPFSWGKPDHLALRKLCWEKFGWGTKKADELLLPVLKEYNRHETQMRLEAFYTFNERFAKIRSKRIKKAVKGIAGTKSSELTDDSLQNVSTCKKRKKANIIDVEVEKSSEISAGLEHAGTEDDTSATAKSGQRKSRRTQKKVVSGGGDKQSVGGRGRGRGGSERQRNAGKSSRPDKTNISSDEESTSDKEQDMQAEKIEESLRRSGRPRRAVNYTVDDLISDESEKKDQASENSIDEDIGKEELDQVALEDAAAGPSKIIKNEGSVLSQEQNPSGGYLELGGGFCADENEEVMTGQLSAGQRFHLAAEAQSSEDYLNFGGGFCLDEDNANEELSRCSSSPRGETIFGTCDIPNNTGLPGDISCEIGIPAKSDRCPEGPSDQVQVGVDADHTGKMYASDAEPSVSNTTYSNYPRAATLQGAVQEHNSGSTPVSYLRAMPNLKRKRRKS